MEETSDEFREELTPTQIESVRRLLAASRVTDPMPIGVRGRLDDVLRDLAAERTSAAMESPTPDRAVIDLSARRRRVRSLLVAAAAVTVIAVAAPRLVSSVTESQSDSASSNAGETTTLNESGSQPGAAGSEAPAREGTSRLTEAPDTSDDADNGATDTVALMVRPDRFAADAEKIRDLVGSAAADFTPVNPGCLQQADRDLIRGQQIPVRYAGRDAVLVLAKAADGEQEANLYLCGEATARRTTVLPAE
jgi:hypothetical protein